MNEFFDFEISFHGTDEISTSNILNGNINVSLSGGELGKGFYTGNSYHNAKAWAFYKVKQSKLNPKILAFKIPIEDFLTLKICLLDDLTALQIYLSIKEKKLQKAFLLDYDVAESKILGKEIEGARQYKWESIDAQNFLNSNNLQKKEIDDKKGYGNIYLLWY